jgi:hypothetical protein
MNYEQAKTQISDGDLVALKRTDTWFWWLVSRVTRSPYTHTAIAVRVGNGVFVVELHWSGPRIVPLRSYRHPFDVFSCPVSQETVRRAAFAFAAKRIRYDWLDLFRIGLFNLFRLRPAADQGGLVCSSFNARIYRYAGWQPPPKFPRIPSPGAMVRALNTEPTLEVDP